MSSDERQTGRLERVDSSKLGCARTLPDQLGHRLRNVFVAPVTQEDGLFDDVLKRISGILP